MLMRYFPELCKAIKTRHGKYRAARIAAVELQMNGALIEHPPPSWKEVVSRLEYSEGYIRRMFREKAKAIKKRYRKFRRSLSAEAKTPLKQIALALDATVPHHELGRAPRY